MPPEGFDFLRYQFALGTMLTVAAAGAEDYRSAQVLPGAEDADEGGVGVADVGCGKAPLRGWAAGLCGGGAGGCG
jgi:hypothetical protein